jgi:hypothetical protein
MTDGVMIELAIGFILVASAAAGLRQGLAGGLDASARDYCSDRVFDGVRPLSAARAALIIDAHRLHCLQCGDTKEIPLDSFEYEMGSNMETISCPSCRGPNGSSTSA